MKLIETLDTYYSIQVNSYNLILSPLLHAGGYGPRLEANNGMYDIYGIIGPDDITESENGLILEYSSELIRYLICHEFSHSFVNLVTEKYIDEVNMYKDLFFKIKEQMKSEACISWEVCVKEHIVRAVTARLIYLSEGKSAYEEIIEHERSKGFCYIDELCESLSIYEKNRDIYLTFESYFIELIKVFRELYKQ